MDSVTLVTTYYRQPKMLAKQLETWGQYSPEVLHKFRFIVVDDGSPEPARDVIKSAPASVLGKLDLYRIEIDIPWNHPGARNLGCHVAPHGWILRVDLDHVLLPEQAEVLLAFTPRKKHWYRLQREWVKTLADGTEERGWRKPHVDSYLIHRSLYWEVGGYDEDYSGCYFCVDLEFFKLLGAIAEGRYMDAILSTFSSVEDSSTPCLSRGKDMEVECKQRRKQKLLAGRTKPENPLRFPWRQVF